MALTRKMLKALGLEEEKIEQIIDAHIETVDGLRNDLNAAKEEAAKVSALQEELKQAQTDLKAAQENDWQERYNTVKKDFEEYKQQIKAKETKAAKEAAVKSYYQEKGVTGKALDIAMRGSVSEIEAVTLDTDGKIADTKILDDLLAGDFSGLIGQVRTIGANTAAPPANTGGGVYTDKSQIMAIKDRSERRAAIAANMGLFEKGS